MIKSYLKILFRNFLKNKASSLINFIGLSIAFALFILLILFASNELTTDYSHKKADRIYRLIETKRQVTGTLTPFGPYISENYPEVEQVCRMYFDGGTFSVDDIDLPIRSVVIVDSSYFKIFTHELIWGDLDKALIGKNGLVLTETVSKKLFGNENPIGNVVMWSDEISLIVNAVIKDLPNNSSIIPGAFVSFPCLKDRDAIVYQGNQDWALTTWVLLKENGVKDKLIAKMSPDLNEKFGENTNFGLQNLTDIYLNKFVSDYEFRHGNLQLIYLFIGLAVFIIIVASINYINLTTAQANIRAKEVSIRKVVGANKKILIIQFLLESCILVFISLIAGFLIAEFFIPKFNLLTEAHLKVKSFYAVKYLAGFICGGIALGVLSGIYPAFVLNTFKPIEVIKGKTSKSKGSLIARRALLVFQFIISMIMIVGTIMIFRQVDYVKHADLGFNQENVIVLRPWENLVQNDESIKNELLVIPGVDMISVCIGLPGQVKSWMGDSIEGKEIEMQRLSCDENYFELMEIEILDGHGFTSASTDIGKNFLLNETALKYLGWDDPYKIKIQGMNCIGIVKDFNIAPLHQPIGPLFITYKPYMGDLCIRFSGDNVQGIIKSIENIWKSHYPEKPFNFSFLDEVDDGQYQAEERLGEVIGYFALFALLISILGLTGITSFMIQNKIKEIGIRKVHGCSTTQIIGMFSFDFLKWLLIAFIISTPISWYLVDYWLQNFAYRVNIDWWVFAISGIISLVISQITIVSLTYRAAKMNPVESLRYE